MCFDLDSAPPIRPIAGAAAEQRSLTLRAADGAEFRAFHAVPAQPSGNAIVILPDIRGLHHYYEELATRFAETGVQAIAIDYFGRTAGTADRPADFDSAPHVAQTTWTGIADDIRTAVNYLRTGQTAARAGVGSADMGSAAEGRARVFATGFCMGGRNAFDAATLGLGLAGVIGFYGWPSGPSRNDTPAPVEVVGQFECPVLGIFGGADQGISIAVVQSFRDALATVGVDHDIVVEPDAPHGFFDRKAAEFAAQSDDAWRRVQGFIHHYGAH